MLAAKSLGIPTATFIFSWDNLSSKGRIAAPFDYYLVWSEHMGDEWGSFTERLRRLEREAWTFSTISDAGELEPISLSAVFERGRFSQVVMQREGA